MHTSGLLFLFWLLMSICGFPQFYTDIKNLLDTQEDFINGNFTEFIEVVSYPFILLMLLLNIFADKIKTDSKSPVLNVSIYDV